MLHSDDRAEMWTRPSPAANLAFGQIPNATRETKLPPLCFASSRERARGCPPGIHTGSGEHGPPAGSGPALQGRNPNLSDERDLERLRFLPPDEDLERLRFCPPSGEEEGERDLFWGEEPFPDLELDLLEE
ncbi:hypothetical protein F2P81_005598 [Scophthalmus maximus]|uniref:Uncharacterized protein n=1 Tax=Scophthalmus maximus TaxID=52904 RepID=A0A6A4T3J4_SCOMX|nr:hypothetical protein F2P81_005598 [Scophthalmus maximus]